MTQAAPPDPAAASRPEMVPGVGTSLYVHVPFCVVKCGYCDFHSYAPDGDAPLDRYLEGLEAELAGTHGLDDLVSVFVGGGTPSYFDQGRFERFWDVLGGAVDLARVAEVTVEMNPESATEAKGATALAAGVSRFSLGAQSFSPERLAFLDRPHDGPKVAGAVAALRRAGARNINLDMIFGLPGQRLGEWLEDLDEALSLQPDHLSCYHLTFEPGTRLTRDLNAGRVQSGDEDIALDMLLRTRERLRDAGFAPYEISNFAGAGGPCLHNDHYWMQGNSIGVGPGASSHRDGVRVTNLKAMDAWCDAVQAGLPGAAEAETLSPRRRLGEALWLGLRRAGGMDVAGLGSRLGLDAVAILREELAGFAAQGLLHWDGRVATLTDIGLPVADMISERFLV